MLFYEQDSSKVFSNTDIKGGVVVTYRDTTQVYGAIETFTPYDELNSIFHKVFKSNDFSSFSKIVESAYSYHLRDVLYIEHPELRNRLSKGHEKDLKSNIFDKLPQVFYDEKPDDGQEYIQILGRENNSRVYKYIRKDYVNNAKNLYNYKVFMPKAIGKGVFGETFSNLLIGSPSTGNTETFISIGIFDLEICAVNARKYISTKFTRSLLGILKTTQDITPEKWKYVPLQDFTPTSDIDWSKSIPEIDQQLYKKYDLTPEEIKFIETHVKEMD